MTAEATKAFREAAVAHAMGLWKEGVCNAKAGSTDKLADDSGWGSLTKTDGATGKKTITDWCGIFVAACFRRVGLHGKLRKGFYEVTNVIDFFTYTPATRVAEFIGDKENGPWERVSEVHAARGSVRRWLDHAAIESATLATLDIVPGDVVLIDHEGDGRPNHITLAESYDPSTGVLVTIEGNGIGKVCKSVNADGSVTEGDARGPSVVRNRRDLNDATARKKIFGVGRMSAVDFEKDRWYARAGGHSFSVGDVTHEPIEDGDDGGPMGGGRHEVVG